MERRTDTGKQTDRLADTGIDRQTAVRHRQIRNRHTGRQIDIDRWTHADRLGDRHRQTDRQTQANLMHRPAVKQAQVDRHRQKKRETGR